MKKNLLTLLLIITSATILQAQTITAAQNGNWSATSTWVGGVVPTAANTVIIPGYLTVTVDVGNAACANLELNDNTNNSVATLALNPGTTLTVSGTLTIGIGGSGRQGSISMASSSNLRIGGSINEINMSQFLADPTANIEYYAAGNQTIHLFSGHPGLILSGSNSKTLPSIVDWDIFGSLIIMPGVELAMNNNVMVIRLHGNFSNQGFFNFVASTVSFVGSAPTQFIFGTSAFTLFALTINKPSGHVQLAIPINLNGQLTLTNGELITSASSMLTINNSGGTFGASDLSFVSGPMTKIGNTDFTFPVGKSGAGLRNLQLNQVPAAPLQTVTIEFFRGPAPNRGSIGTPAVYNVSACEYWSVAGNFTQFSPILHWTASSPCNGVPYVTDLQTLRAAVYNGSSWSNPGRLGTFGTTTIGALVGDVIPGGSVYLALGSSTTNTNPLPLNLLSFEANTNNCSSNVQWKTASEVNVNHFELQVSFDNSNWNTLQTISANNNTGVNNYNYNYNHSSRSGNKLLRLKMVDNDGKFTYSKVISVQCGKDNILSVYPNLASTIITVTGTKAGEQLHIIAMDGRILQQQTAAGGNSTIGIEALPSGIYYIRVLRKNEWAQAGRFMKQ